MPVLYFFAYFLLEALAFWAVSSWLGVGWALLILFATMFFGMAIAGFEARRIMNSNLRRDDHGQLVYADATPGRTAGNVGLTMAGGVLLSIPGMVTTIVGLLLVFPPTRAIIRPIVAASIMRKLNKMTVRIFESSPMSRNHTTFGSFKDPNRAANAQHTDENTVIDEDEIRKWSENLDPDDFTGGNPHGGEEPKDGPR